MGDSHLKFFLVDAFVSETSWSGNPAGVVLLSEPREESWMQAVAAEMNQAETAFVTPDLNLRWFTPAVEVDLCGHATLATAHVLKLLGEVRDQITFQSKSGPLGVEYGELITLNFPEEPVQPDENETIRRLCPRAGFIGRNRMDWLAELTVDDVRSFLPDMNLISSLGLRGLILTSVDGEQVVSRFFAPQSGVPEDHVTGSAHCAIGPYWAPRLGSQLSCYQASPRGGRIDVEVEGDRVLLSGRARVVFEGTLQV